jgi:protein TonB
MTMPVYPAKALRERVRGVVVLRVLVSETGEPMEVVVERGARKDLNDAALEAARHWRFEPAKKDGHPVRTYTTVRFPFEGVQFARTPLAQFGVTPSP